MVKSVDYFLNDKEEDELVSRIYWGFRRPTQPVPFPFLSIPQGHGHPRAPPRSCFSAEPCGGRRAAGSRVSAVRKPAFASWHFCVSVSLRTHRSSPLVKLQGGSIKTGKGPGTSRKLGRLVNKAKKTRLWLKGRKRPILL